MRGILVAVACVLLRWGCSCSERKLLGRTDADVDINSDGYLDPLDEMISPGTCGNGIVEGTEECDDGDDDDCNGCSTMCTGEMAMRVSGTERGAVINSEMVPPSVLSPFTLEFWFRLDEEDSQLTILNDAGTVYIAVRPEGFLFSFPYSGGWSDIGWPGGISEIGCWHHFAFTTQHEGDMGRYTAFLNGMESFRSDSDYTHIGLFTGRTIEIGNMSEGIGAGTLDDIRISNVALYAPSSAPFTPERRLQATDNTIALWDFDSVEDDVIHDASDRGHDAVLLNGILVPDDCHLP